MAIQAFGTDIGARDTYGRIREDGRHRFGMPTGREDGRWAAANMFLLWFD